MTVGNKLFNMRASCLVPYGPGPSKSQVHYFLTRRDQRKFAKDIKVLPTKQCFHQHKPLVCEKEKDIETTWR